MRIAIKTTCTATVEERWVFDLPDEEAQTLLDADNDTVLAYLEDEGSTPTDVENLDVYDETDRVVTSVTNLGS